MNTITRRSLLKQVIMASDAVLLSRATNATTQKQHMKEPTNFHVIIIGGSYAGMSAAMALGRSVRNVLIIDAGKPCNRQTPHSHNFLTQDGTTPAALHATARTQVLAYPTVQCIQATAISATPTAKGYTVTTQEGHTYTSRKLILATGIADTMPDVPGFADCWGISAIHCPYCHGYEYRGQPTGIWANGDRAMHLATLVANLTPHLTLFTNGPAAFSPQQMSSLQRRDIHIAESPIAKVLHEHGHMRTVVLQDGASVPVHALYAALPFTQHSQIPQALGCVFTEMGHVQTDAFQKTNISGVFACGDNASPLRAVANAVYAGNIAGVVANKELADEDF
jgi:thioredoxin reductase